MAISMKKWVDITSGSLPAGVSDRELILRLITSNESITPEVVYEMTTLADVGSIFGTGSTEYAIAMKYFSFISLSATKPEKISFWRPAPAGQITKESTVSEVGEGVGYCTVYSYKAKDASGGGKEYDPTTRTANYMLVTEWLQIKYRILKASETTWDATTSRYWNVVSSTDFSYADADTYSDTLPKMVDASDNFATFFFVDPPSILDRNSQYTKTDSSTGKEVVDPTDTEWLNSANMIAAWCASENYRFRYVQQVDITRIANKKGGITWEQIYGSNGKIDGPGSAVEYINRINKSCVTAVLDDAFVNLDGETGASNGTTHPEWLTCALLASTKYSRSNSTIIQEFKALNSTDMLVTCTTDSLFTILSGLNVNFFGQTQKAGQLVNFYMEGFNLDGTDTSVCDNEIWLKDRVTSEVFNRFVKCNKVPAGTVGRAMIKAALNGVIAEGLNNLAVQPEKTISESDKAAIIQNTGATDAPALIYNNGYYLAVNDGDTVTTNGAKHRVVDYILYYSTGEGIRKVTGSHVLV